MADNPFPAIMGRVCYRPCETACNRAELDEAVGINSVERFLGDEAIRQGWTVPAPKTRSGKRVLVIGAGPAGLAAAYHLVRFGHDVTVRDAGDKPGGMMRYGIPAYRLPRDVLDAEIQRIADLGVTLELNSPVENAADALRDGGYDAVFLAVGAHVSRRAYIPAGDSARILDAVTVLRSMEGEDAPLLGRRVAIYGGGNTALDVARTARRLGATDPIIVYRRTRDRMPAHDFEVEEAIEEGVRMNWLSTVADVGDGTITIEKMRLDESGFPQPTGEYEELAADSLVLAIGQVSDLSLLHGVEGVTIKDAVVEVGPDMMTGHPGIFAGGDMAPSDRTVTTAVGHGKLAARNIDAWLRGRRYAASEPAPLASYDKLNTWYYSDAANQHRPRLDVIDGEIGFVSGLCRRRPRRDLRHRHGGARLGGAAGDQVDSAAAS